MEAASRCIKWAVLFFILVNIANCVATVEVSRSFTIDYENNQFLKDGQPFRYVSGSFHYFRAPRAYWQDRLRKLRAAGLNAVSTYVEWSQHEPSPGNFVFTGELDLVHFIQLAQEEDLLVLLRPGPYICAERDMGGLPSWLLNIKPDIQLRTSDATYIQYADRYLRELMTLIQPHLYGNGGPIILVQVENEYGSYSACDAYYTAHLRDVIKSFVDTAALLYTTDGGSTGSLRCGKIPDVYATVDFGSGGDVSGPFAAERTYEPNGPLINSEFYPGWLTHWGESLHTVGTTGIVNTLNEMLSRNASVNFYMFYGGTNFAFTAGANYGNNYQPQITSYDYDAPLTEAGDPTSKYLAIREAIGKYLPLPNVTVPSPSPKGNYGSVSLNPVSLLLNSIPEKLPVRNEYPLTFEALGQKYGFVLYETTLEVDIDDPSQLSIPEIRDRATVMVDGVPKGILSRADKITSMPLSIQVGQKLQILVENQGRINFGSYINDFKGIFSNVTLGTTVLRDWNITGYPLNDISQFNNISSIENNFSFVSPTFFRGVFKLPETSSVLDTYLDTTGWGKGVAFINGFNLGRYWPVVGPQVTLYVPGVHLKSYPEDNILIVLELEQAQSPYQMVFRPDPILDRLPQATNTVRSAHILPLQQLNQGSIIENQPQVQNV